MPGKITRIAASLALLLYSVGASEAHTLNVFPTGENIGAAQSQTPQAAAAAAPAYGAQAPSTAAPLNSSAAPAKSPRRVGKRAGAKPSGSSRTRAARASAARKPGAASAAGVEKRRQRLTTEYYNHAGRRLVITSGQRTPASQAQAIYKNIKKYGVASVVKVYRNKAAIREIVAAYKPRRLRPRRAIAAMTRVIEAQTQRGVFVSRHLLGRAFDVRSRGRNGARLSVLREVAQGMGGRVLVERNHYHVEM